MTKRFAGAGATTTVVAGLAAGTAFSRYTQPPSATAPLSASRDVASSRVFIADTSHSTVVIRSPSVGATRLPATGWGPPISAREEGSEAGSATHVAIHVP